MLTISETFNKLNQSEVTAGEGGKGLKELSVKSLSWGLGVQLWQYSKGKVEQRTSESLQQ